MKTKRVDKVFLGLSVLLVSTGLFVFTSASFGLIFRKGFTLWDVFFDQFVLGLMLGLIALILVLYLPLKLLRTYALYIFIASLALTLLVFVPGIGVESGGAKRWIFIGSISFQPAEALKLATIIYLAALLPLFKDRIMNMKYAYGILGGVLALPAIILLAQPNTSTLAILFVAVCAMLLSAGMKIRHFLILFLVAILALGVIATVRPYVKERVLTFLDASHDPQGASYQIQKSLIAIGSGGITGRGFGQSIQKFGSLPEPTGDSIFAVMGEEFGFIGGAGIIVIFLLFAIRGLQIARRAQDSFSGLLAVGIVILIITQSFTNIAAMLAIVPLTGVPLVFVSHGGTALFFALLEIGILLNISKLAVHKKISS
ncbi:MAG: putative peptidoglycan glycosyltransferase FtsW [Patescibacteria group bacterium]